MEAGISLRGMYDLHVHAAPSIQRRTCTALEALKLASTEEMGGILLLDHTYNTEVIAQVLNGLGYKSRAFGAIMLNESVGGLSPSVVEVAIGLGTKQIEMPTYSSRHHQETIGDDQRVFPYKKRSKVYILDDRGRLIPEVEDILDLLKGSSSFLGTWHLSAIETETLVSRAKDRRIPVLVTGASNQPGGIPIETQKQMVCDNVMMEHEYGALLRAAQLRRTPIESMVEKIRAVGAERCVIATDAGLLDYPDLVHSLKDFIKRLMEKGITEKEIDFMTRQNPRILLGIS
jgi:hypothetical protein